MACVHAGVKVNDGGTVAVPGQNPHHIRVVSNSWGSDGDYDPQGTITQLTDRLTYENDVAVIFAASNPGFSVSDGLVRVL